MEENNNSLNSNIKSIEEIAAERWSQITICNDYVFCKVMQDEELLSELIRSILPDISFTRLVIQAQKPIESGMDIHGVRFDIFVMDEDGTAIEIEMQVVDTGSLPRRLRFYGSMADTQMLEKGIVYSKLKDSYIVMICPFDQFGQGLYRYTFTNRCKEVPELEMNDGTTKIILNAVGTHGKISDRLKAFLNYVAGKPSEDEYIKKLDEAVKKTKANKEWRKEYMTLIMRDLENQEIGVERGKEQEQRTRIAAMLRKGKTVEAIADFCDYPITLVKEVAESLAVAQ